ncbi:MAG: hypothetical protein Q9191_001825 [Dirinaria sp. TL-2023a]
MSRKRRRDQTTIDGQLVEIYEDLAHEDENVRLKAAQNLLLKLASEQDPPRTQHTTNVLTRLIRGLCSGRKAARLGFSVALIELLAQSQDKAKSDAYAHIDVQDVIVALIQHSTASGNVSGKEVRDHNFGRLFGAEAIIRSGVLFSAGVSGECWAQIVDIICELAKKKVQLREECGWVLYRAVKDVSVQKKHRQHIEYLLRALVSNGLTKTPEGVAIWLASQSGVQIQLPHAVWEHDDPLHREEKSTIVKVMTEAFCAGSSENEDNSVTSKKRNWSPKLHFAWDVVLSTLIREQHSEAREKVNSERLSLKSFWNGVVDSEFSPEGRGPMLNFTQDSLFSMVASDERKFWGFIVFQRVLQSGPADLIPIIFSTNLMRCLMNQLASSERYLHRVAQNALRSIFARVDQEHSATILILKGLSGTPSALLNFDQVTKTKTLERLLSKVENGALLDLIPLLSQLLACQNTQDDVAAAASRRMVADQIVAHIRSRQNVVAQDIDGSIELTAFVRRVLSLFAEYAYFVREADPLANDQKTIPPISASSREMFRSRILSCMTHILAKYAQPGEFSYELITYIRLKAQKPENARFLFESDDAIKRIIDKAFVTLDKIHSKSLSSTGPRQRLLNAFQLLYSLTALQVYNGETEAVEVLDELKASYDQLLKHKHKFEKSNSDALVEILLSFVSRPSLLFRRLAQQVFPVCTYDISRHGLQSMLKIWYSVVADKNQVLETRESLAGHGEIFAVDDEEQGSESEEDPSSDVSAAGMVEAVLEPKASTELSNDDDADSSEGADEELVAFNTELAHTLRTQPVLDGVPASDSNEHSDEDMNDEQMEALDEHLEKIFRERKIQVNNRSRNKNAVEAIKNFKCRVLELLGVYVKHQHMNALALALLIPLLAVIRTTKSPIVSSKAYDVIRDFSKLCTPKSRPTLSNSKEVMELLRDVHAQASKDGSKAYGAACSQASLLLVKILISHKRDNLEAIEAMYGQTHLGFMEGPSASHVRASFFTDWLNWSVTARNSQLHAS